MPDVRVTFRRSRQGGGRLMTSVSGRLMPGYPVCKKVTYDRLLPTKISGIEMETTFGSGSGYSLGLPGGMAKKM
eukprot:1031321-Rhodomonas_salina.5